jgi:hypothetical protein
MDDMDAEHMCDLGLICAAAHVNPPLWPILDPDRVGVSWMG